MKGSEAIIETLIKQGTNVTFGYPGGSVIPLYDSFLEYEGKIRNILVRHEQSSAHMADAFGRVTGKPGICIATSGPGATNLVTGIMTAYMDSSPMIALGGQVPVSLLGKDAFQECDMYGVTLPIVKHSFQIKSADKAAETIMKAYKISEEGRPGPVYIDLTKDSQVEETSKNIPDKIDIPSYQPTYKPNPIQLQRAAEAILKAERPIFLIGGGVIWSYAEKELKELVELIHAPVTTTLMGKGVFPEQHPLALGMLGMHGRKSANYAIINSDLIISIGCRFSDRITGNLSSFAENSKIIHIDIDPAEIGKNVRVDIPLVGDAKMVMAELISHIKHKGNREPNAWTNRMKELIELCRCNNNYNSDKFIRPQKVMQVLNKIIGDKDIVCTGVGQHQMFCAHFLQRKFPRTFISSGGAGTMGFGLPAAMGAKVACPEVNVFDIDGDGSFQMVVQELGTIRQENMKIIPVIMNNSYLGMVRQWLEIYFNKRYSQVNLTTNPDFVKLAEAYGLKGIEITKESQLESGLKEAIKDPTTTIVDIHIEPESNILPMLPPGGHLKDAFGGCMIDKGKFF